MFEITLNNTSFLDDKHQYLVKKEDDYCSKEEILADICEIFDLSKKIKFSVVGFDLDKWSVDCMYDLLCVVEVLPNIINGFYQNNYEFNLDFYEQGLERILIFKQSKELIKIECESRTKWIPSPQTEYITKIDLVKMILELYTKFIKYAEHLCGELLTYSVMDEFVLSDELIRELKNKTL